MLRSLRKNKNNNIDQEHLQIKWTSDVSVKKILMWMMVMLNVLFLELILCAILSSDFCLFRNGFVYLLTPRVSYFITKNMENAILQKMWKRGFWGTNPFFSGLSMSILCAFVCALYICKKIYSAISE